MIYRLFRRTSRYFKICVRESAHPDPPPQLLGDASHVVLRLFLTHTQRLLARFVAYASRVVYKLNERAILPNRAYIPSSY